MKKNNETTLAGKTFTCLAMLLSLALTLSSTQLVAQACDCQDYIYLNEPNNGGRVHKFAVDPNDGSLTEIGNPWFQNNGDGLQSPHGLGVDLNGFIYIGENVGNSEIRKFTCDGTISPESEFAVTTNGQFNIGSIGNTIYYNENGSNDAVAVDVCTQMEVGRVQTTSGWGLFVDKETEKIYTLGTGGLVISDPDDFTFPATVVPTETFVDPLPTGVRYGGLWVDSAGNIFILIQQDPIILPTTPPNTPFDTYVLKYDASLNLLATSPVDSDNDGMGFYDSRGLVYSEETDVLYLAPTNETNVCIAALNGTTLQPIPSLTVPGTNGKGIALARECCPTGNTVTQENICVRAGERVFLQDILSCGDGVICEAMWAVETPNAGQVFDDCDLSITINADGFGTYVLEKTTNATGNQQCGMFRIELEVYAQVIDATAFAIQPSCADDVAQSDGYLQLSEVIDGDAYHWSEGDTFDDMGGANTYANATSLAGATYPIQFATGQTNPAGARDYTIRVYRGADDCFIDVEVTMNEQDCTVGCNCNDYIYLNDIELDEIHKFRVNTDGSVTEVGAPWFSGIVEPYGIAADNNGNLYAVPFAEGQFIWKISNTGTLLDNMAIDKEQNGAPSYFTFNFDSRDGILYAVDADDLAADGAPDQIIAYDLCTGTEIGRVNIGATTTSLAWGLELDDTNWYVTVRETATTDAQIFTGSLDTSLFNNPVTNSGTPLFTVADRPMGITRDDAGNFYVITDQNIDGFGAAPSIRKYDPAGNELMVVTDNTDNGFAGQTADGTPGWWGARAIIYSESSDLLYVASFENCITVFDTDLNEISTFNIANPLSGTPKGLGIIRECCPTNNNVTVDTTLCEVTIGQELFLQDLIACEGIIAEGTWMAGAANTGVTFNDCNNSLTIDQLNACGSFTLSSDGTGNAQCGAFTITVNISVNAIIAPEISADQTICSDEEPVAITITTPSQGDDQVAYQWLASTTTDSTGFSPVADATMQEYTPTTASLGGADTTWFRLEVINNDTDCLSGTCADTSNAVFVALFLLPEVSVVEPFTICSTREIDLLQGFTVSPDVLGATWTTPNGTGQFLDLNGTLLTEPYVYGTAVTYRPSAADATCGEVTLILTTDDPAGPCGPVEDSVTVQILKVDCGTYPWGG